MAIHPHPALPAHPPTQPKQARRSPGFTNKHPPSPSLTVVLVHAKGA